MSTLRDVKRAFHAAFHDPRKSQHYEGTFTTNVRRAIKPGHVVVDCGVCAGFYTAIALKAGASAVWAFEPDDAHIPALAEGFKDHPRVHLVPTAVAATTGTVELFKVKNAGGRGISATRKIALKGRLKGVTAKKVTLDCISLDDALPNGADVIKIDAEGSELAILQGARRLLADYNPRVFVQFHDGDKEEVHELVDLVYGLGYKFFDLDGKLTEPEAPLSISCEIRRP